MKGFFKFILFLIIVTIAYWSFLHFGKASNDGDWSTDQAILPYAEINYDEINIFNVRNFRYRSANDYDSTYYNGSYDLSKLETVDFVTQPFVNNSDSTNSFLSFGFNDGRQIAISIEARKKKDQKFSIFQGLFNQYNLTYVIADERDIINLRANYLQNAVYIYPIKTNSENVKKLFTEMLTKANELKNKPEFYNTLTNNSIGKTLNHLSSISPSKIGLDINMLLPGKIDEMVLGLGLINTDLQLYEARKKFSINDRAKKYQDSPAFSIKIRE